MAASAEVSDKQLERLVLRAVAAMVATVLSAGVVAATRMRSARRDQSGATNVVDAPVIAPAGTISLGPPDGADVLSYVAARTAVIAAAGDGDRAAVVSFTGYVTAGEARRRTAGLSLLAFLTAKPRLAPEVTAADPSGERVFGVVVRGPTVTLRTLARLPGVRLVDVGPSNDAPKLTNVTGLRPEETTHTGTPATRP